MLSDQVPLRLSADSRYLLWVNDVEVGRGPIRSQPRRLRYDEYDIARLLRAGRNVIAVLVTYYGRANSFWQPAASSGVMGRDAQLVLEARLGLRGQAGQRGQDWLVTDASWRVARSTAWRALEAGTALDGVPIELLDARHLDPAWTGPDFDDSTWDHAAVANVSHDGGLAESRPPVDPYGAMLPRGIGVLGGQRVVPVAAAVQTASTEEAAAQDQPDHPAERLISHLRVAGPATEASLPLTITQEPGTATVVTVDFGRIVAGHVELDVEAPPRGAAGHVVPGSR